MKLTRTQAVFAALFAVSLIIGRHPLFETFALSVRNDEYSYILLVLPISAVLLFLKSESLRIPGGWDFRLAPALLGIAIVLAVCLTFLPTMFSRDADLSIGMFALVLSWLGIFAFCFGAKALRAGLFPMLFLFGLVPPPQNVLDVVVTWLQESSAWSAHALFAVCGVPVIQQGVFLTIPGLTIQVAQECSSIRSSSILLVTIIVAAQVLLRSPWRKALVIGVTIPLSIAKNGLRIFVIAMLGTRVDPGYLTGRLHHQGGIIFFMIALMAILGLLVICQRGENAPLRTS
jgi:exosortase